jgi:CTP synthase
MFHKNSYDEIVLEHFSLKVKPLKMPEWDRFIKALQNPVDKVRIAVVGKYISLQDSYRSIYEEIFHGAVANKYQLEIVRIDSEELETMKRSKSEALLGDVDGILVPGGFGNRGIEGKILAIQFAREHKKPFFGICLGLHCAVVEYGRNVCGLKGAHSMEIDPDTPHPVISLLEDQEIVLEKGGTMRLGAYSCKFKDGSKIRKIYGKETVQERHRHRYEFTNSYRGLFEEYGMLFGGLHQPSDLVETIELKDHPWFFATQFHPEFKSKPTKPHPLFRDFIRASMEYSAKTNNK